MLLVVAVFLKFSDLGFQMVDVLSANFEFVFQICNLLTGFLFCQFQFLLCPLFQLPNCRRHIKKQQGCKKQQEPWFVVSVNVLSYILFHACRLLVLAVSMWSKAAASWQ